MRGRVATARSRRARMARRTLGRRGIAARASSTWGALVLAVGWLGCASIEVESAVLRDGVDFAALKTFHVVSTPDEEGRVRASIEASIARELAARGFDRAEPEDADMWVVYRASALDRQKRRNAGDPDANSFRIVSYVEGTLAVDVFDHRGAGRIWHGQAVVDDESRARLSERADDIVAAIFAEFPTD